MELLSDYVLESENPPIVPAGSELSLPGFGPLPEEEYLRDGVFDISDVWPSFLFTAVVPVCIHKFIVMFCPCSGAACTFGPHV